MHVHELNPRKTLIAMLVFVALIVVGLLTIGRPRLEYSLDPAQSLVMAENHVGARADAIDGKLSASTKPLVLIDIRNNYEYARGHIASARNISPVGLLEEGNIEWLHELKDNMVPVIIYGGDHLQAIGPWMVLRQLGFDNVDYLNGGFDLYVLEKGAQEENRTIATVEYGKARYNYANYAKGHPNVRVAGTEGAKQQVVVRRKKKSKATAGGC